MKHLKILGLAAIAAMAFMAFASSASADVLCKAAPNKEGKCPTASGDYTTNQVFKASASDPVLTATAFGVSGVTCETGATEVKQTGTGGAKGTAVPGEVADLTFSNCKTTGFIVTACTVGTSKGYVGSITATNDVGGGVLSTSSAVTTNVSCPGVGMNCNYSPKAGTPVTLDITGGNPAKFVASEETLTSTGSGCPETAKWDATYTLTSPTALWVATEMD
jgi:hypothetical protein